MKFNKLFLVIIIGLFLVGFSSAVVEVNYTVYKAIIEDDDSSTLTTIPVNDFDVKGYACLDVDCLSLSSEILTETSNGNEVSVYFPTDKMTDYGYLLYFHRDGYIGWEQWGIQAWGHGSYTNPDSIYLSKKASGYAPIQITPDISAPTQSLAEGQLTLVGGVTYLYDSTRNKWLSINREFPSFIGRFGCGNFLSADKHGGINVGFMALRAATITGITSVVGWGTQNKTFHIMKNGVYTSLQSFTMSAGKLIDDTLDINIDAGDTIQIYFNPGPQAYSPRINLEIAWRL